MSKVYEELGHEESKEQINRRRYSSSSDAGGRLRGMASFSTSERSSESEVVMEIEEAMDVIGFGSVQMRVIGVVGLLLSADAMEMMILSFLGPSIACDWNISEEQEALLTTVVFLGMLFGAYACGVLADRIGRRLALKYVSMVSFALAVLSALVPSYELLLLVRALLGFTLGGLSIAFAYVMEFLPTSHRGRWGILLELFWSLGTFIECVLAWVTFTTSSSQGAWRILLLLSSIPVFIGASCFAFNLVPVSPRYLATTGQYEEAYAVLRQMAKANGKELPANGVLKEHGHGNNAGKKNPFQFGKVLRAVFSPSFRKLTLFLWFLWFTNSFSYYGIVLLTTSLAVEREAEDGGRFCDPETKSAFKDSSQFVEVFVSTVAELPGTLLAVFLVDRIGRKLSQGLCFSVAFTALVVMFFATGSASFDTVCLFFARAMVTASFVLLYVYTPEVYPTSMRTTAFGLCISFSRLGGMVSPFVGEDLVENGKVQQAIFVFALFIGLATVTALMLPVETSGQALKDTAEDFEDDGLEMAETRSNGSSDDPSTAHVMDSSNASVTSVELNRI